MAAITQDTTPSSPGIMRRVRGMDTGAGSRIGAILGPSGMVGMLALAAVAGSWFPYVQGSLGIPLPEWTKAPGMNVIARSLENTVVGYQGTNVTKTIDMVESIIRVRTATGVLPPVVTNTLSSSATTPDSRRNTPFQSWSLPNMHWDTDMPDISSRPFSMTAIATARQAEQARLQAHGINEFRSMMIRPYLNGTVTATWIHTPSQGTWATVGPMTARACGQVMSVLPLSMPDRLRVAVTSAGTTDMPQAANLPTQDAWRVPDLLSRLSQSCPYGNEDTLVSVAMALVPPGENVNDLVGYISRGEAQ